MPIFRPLHTKPLALAFVKGVLEISEEIEVRTAVDSIVNAETGIITVSGKDTMVSEDYRDVFYNTNEKRKGLRQIILQDLVVKARLEEDDNIKLGVGGALPCIKDNNCTENDCRGIEPCQRRDNIPSDREAFIIIGLPASGKSGIATKIADFYKAVIVDSDYVKRKFPEFNSHDFGAYLVHEESNDIVFGESGQDKISLMGYCIFKGYNVVIPKIGYSTIGVLKITKELIDADYKVHLVLVSLDRKKATQRAYRRFKSSGRYVPLSLIFDAYSNDPILTYYRLRKKRCFTSYGKVSTDGSISIIEASKKSPITKNILKIS